MNYKIPCYWEMYGYLNIEADSLDEAITIAENDETIPLPHGEYIGNSFKVDHDYVELFNENTENKHICKPFKYCMCSIDALEPDENCSIHGVELQSRCRCGRFVKG